MKSCFLRLIKECKILQRAFFTALGVVLLVLIFDFSFVYLDMGGFISFSAFFNLAGEILFGVQVWLWIGWLLGLSCALFFTFFPRIFGKGDIPINKEIDELADLKRQTEKYLEREEKLFIKWDKIIFFNFSIVFVCLLLLGISFVFLAV